MSEKPTKKHYIYWTFSEIFSDGYNYVVFNEEIHQSQLKLKLNGHTDYTYVGEVKLPLIDNHTVVKQAAKAIDKDIEDLQLKILQKREKKQQLLALEYQA